MKRSTSVLTAGRSRARDQPMRNHHHNRPTKAPRGVEALKGRLVGLAALRVDQVARLVDQAGPLGGLADLLGGLKVHLAKKRHSASETAGSLLFRTKGGSV